jgi:large subunit ribosomal protein L36e
MPSPGSLEKHLLDYRLGIRVGVDKGYQTTALPKRVKPSHRKGTLSQKNKFVRSVVREVAGFTPYERRVMELLRNSKVGGYALCISHN